jgi:hypothetical protein
MLTPAFLSPAAILASSPHQSTTLKGRCETFPIRSFQIFASVDEAARMSELWINGHRHGGRDTLR